jgi:hypothetical protein
MTNFHLIYQDKLRRQVCAKHKMSPSINLVDGKIVLRCCCKEFKYKCYDIIIDTLKEYKNENPLSNYDGTHKLKAADTIDAEAV